MVERRDLLSFTRKKMNVSCDRISLSYSSSFVSTISIVSRRSNKKKLIKKKGNNGKLCNFYMTNFLIVIFILKKIYISMF